MRRRGFTLIEMMVYIAILSIFMLMLLECFILGRKQFFVAKAQSDSTASAQVGSSRLQVYITSASNVTMQLANSATATGTGSADAGFMFISALPPGGSPVFLCDSTGNTYMQQIVCFWHDGSKRALMMSTLPLTNTQNGSPGTALSPAAINASMNPNFTAMTSLSSKTTVMNDTEALFVFATSNANNNSGNPPNSALAPGPGNFTIGIRALPSVANPQPTGLNITGTLFTRNN